jgi:hypothetical protein
MSLTHAADAGMRLYAADKRLAAALAQIRAARGLETPTPPPGYQAGPAATIAWQGEVMAEICEHLAALAVEVLRRTE